MRELTQKSFYFILRMNGKVKYNEFFNYRTVLIYILWRLYTMLRKLGGFYFLVWLEREDFDLASKYARILKEMRFIYFKGTLFYTRKNIWLFILMNKLWFFFLSYI
jgi:hypothetical protein